MFVVFAAEYRKASRWREHRLFYPISELARPLSFPADIFLSGASWILDPSMVAANW